MARARVISRGAKPKPDSAKAEFTKRAFNGVTVGGHLAEAKAAINSPRAAMNGAQSVFQRREEPPRHNVNSSCGDSSQRDELLAKIAEAKGS